MPQLAFTPSSASTPIRFQDMKYKEYVLRKEFGAVWKDTTLLDERTGMTMTVALWAVFDI